LIRSELFLLVRQIQRQFNPMQSSSAPEKAQQRPEEFEESHYKFPDAFELIPVRDTHKRLEDHFDRVHCTICRDADENGKGQCKQNSGARFMTRMIAVTNHCRR
jgi:hypothetical protein